MRRQSNGDQVPGCLTLTTTKAACRAFLPPCFFPLCLLEVLQKITNKISNEIKASFSFSPSKSLQTWLVFETSQVDTKVKNRSSLGSLEGLTFLMQVCFVSEQREDGTFPCVRTYSREKASARTLASDLGHDTFLHHPWARPALVTASRPITDSSRIIFLTSPPILGLPHAPPPPLA